MSRDDDIEAIIEHGRRTRAATPSWLWMIAAIVGGGCAIAFAIAVFGDAEPARSGALSADGHAVEARPASGGGLGIGLVIGVCVGIVIGFSIARQRADHSSRNSP